MISIIIPTYNEADGIAALLSYLNEHSEGLIEEVIVSDGGSKDDTAAIAETFKVRVAVSPQKGRAAQLNFGASLARGEVLYFLHADTFPPQTFARQITQAYRNGFAAGCFRLRLDHPSLFLKANCWFTRFNVNNVRFGDQSLFVSKVVFEKAGRFNTKLLLVEDQEIIGRIRRNAKFVVLKDAVLSSARKYVTNGVVKTQAVYFAIYFMYKSGFSQQSLVHAYRRWIRQDKV
jgi:rSAM/selenodomain-associated transferase 2